MPTKSPLEKRLCYKAGRRGTREADLSVGRLTQLFLDTHPGEEALSRWNVLLDEADETLLGWCAQPVTLPESYKPFQDVFLRLKGQGA